MELGTESEESLEALDDAAYRKGIKWPLEEAVLNSWVGCKVTKTTETKKGRQVSVTDIRIGKVWSINET